MTRRMCADASLSEDISERAASCASEVITNAVVHGKDDSRLTVTTLPSSVLVEVGDAGRSFAPEQTPVTVSGHGRGLKILGAWASGWGIRETPPGKVVWFNVTSRD